MFSRKSREPLPDFSEVKSHMKPLFGLAPGIYMTVVYTLLSLTLAFFVFFFPGIRSWGTRVSFESSPEGAAIWIDGAYKGATPSEVFVPAGTREVELRKTFYRPQITTERFGARLFGTLFFPRKRRFDKVLELSDPDGLLNRALDQFTVWGMQTEFSLSYRLPPHLTEAARELGNYAKSGEREKLLRILLNAAFFVDSPSELWQLIGAFALAESGGGFLTVDVLVRMKRRIYEFAERFPSMPYWLASALATRQSGAAGQAGDLQTFHESESFIRFNEAYVGRLSAFARTTGILPRESGLVFETITFEPVPAGRYLSGRPLEGEETRVDRNFPYPVALDGFFMGRTEITNRQYKRFVDSEPSWSKTNLSELLDAGWVTEDYLRQWQGDRYPEGTADHPVVFVSHFAAEAFSRWLDTRIPPEYEARLPYSEEWEWASLGGVPGDRSSPLDGAIFLNTGRRRRAGSSPANPFGLHDMMGNVWEWCAEGYLPARNLLHGREGKIERTWVSSERIVRGGSWANDKDDIKVYTEGSQPPSWCTPYLGFRVVIEVP
jgi:formylglycine-generating enzyme required for sulfatase activity